MYLSEPYCHVILSRDSHWFESYSKSKALCRTLLLLDSYSIYAPTYVDLKLPASPRVLTIWKDIIGQDHRFDLAKGIGCMASVHPSTPAAMVVWMPQIVMCILSLLCSGASFALTFIDCQLKVIRWIRHDNLQSSFCQDNRLLWSYWIPLSHYGYRTQVTYPHYFCVDYQCHSRGISLLYVFISYVGLVAFLGPCSRTSFGGYHHAWAIRVYRNHVVGFKIDYILLHFRCSRFWRRDSGYHPISI